MNYKSILTFLILLICVVCCTTVVTRAESLEEKKIQEISEKNLILQIEEKIPLEELEKEFPQEMEVALDSGETEVVSVTWKCEVDYENEVYDNYIFEIQFPEGYVLSDSCASAFIMVVLNEAAIPENYVAWGANPNSTKRFDAYLGVTGNVVEWLESHEADDYYLGTPYYGKLDYPKKCTRANGEYLEMGYDSAGMNCTGFVASVMRKLGGDLSKIVEYSDRGKYANAYNWHYTAHNKSIKSYRYTSVKKMLASGRLEKGDIIYFEPDWSLDGVDCHMGFFWGDTSDDNKFWHSIKGEGNIISEIKSKSSYEYVYIFKNTPPGKLELVKSSANTAITESNLNYELANAVFGVYSDYDEESGTVSNEVGKLITTEKGESNTISLDAGTYYVKELTAPKGYVCSDDVKEVTLTSGKTTTVSFTDEPQTSKVDIVLQKIDQETGKSVPIGTGEFKDAEFTVKFYYESFDDVASLENEVPAYTWHLKTDENGLCKMSDEYKVSGDDFILDLDGNVAFPLGTVTVQETKAPFGYLINEEIFVSQILPSEDGSEIAIFQSVVVPEAKIPETPIIPETGDNANVNILVVMLVLSGIVILEKIRRKRTS